MVVAGNGEGGGAFCVRCALNDDVRVRCTIVYVAERAIHRRMCCARVHESLAAVT